MPRDRAPRDELAHLGELDVRFMQPYQAVKAYLCPDCGRDIAPATGHYVVVPRTAPDLRRHWHRGCWERRADRAARGASTKGAGKARGTARDT